MWKAGRKVILTGFAERSTFNSHRTIGSPLAPRWYIPMVPTREHDRICILTRRTIRNSISRASASLRCSLEKKTEQNKEEEDEEKFKGFNILTSLFRRFIPSVIHATPVRLPVATPF